MTDNPEGGENTAGPNDDFDIFAQLPPVELGPVLKEVRSLIEDNLLPEPIVVCDPITGARAPAVKTKAGLLPVPVSLFDEYQTAPRFRGGEAELTNIDSLIEHVNRFKDADSALFAWDSRESPSITAVLNYNRAGAEAAPRWGHHRSNHAFPLSDEWQAWTKTDGQIFRMAEFAAFLEDRIIDVLEVIPGEDSLPEDLQRFINICGGKVATPNRLVELSRGLHVNENSVVKEAINLASGEGQIVFEAAHTDGQGMPLQVPGLFLIGIPVFKHGPIYRLAARLRYRKEGGIKFWFELWRADRAFDHAFAEACERVRVETELPLLFGRPE
jgi:hypothetical protein